MSDADLLSFAGEIGDPVLVDYSGRTLFGRLSLYPISEEAAGPVKQSYLIQVPGSYLRSAEAGNLTVLYEIYRVDGAEFFAWILFLSNRPI